MSPHPVQSGKQPDNPQQTPQQSRPQALLHLHDCPIAAAARNTCAHTDNNNKSDCAICQVTAHDEAARRGWLELVCICELHNPHPRLNTLAGRHKLDQAVRTTGAKELVTLSWARGTINALAQILDDNFERVLQARISGRQSITEDDVRVINEAGKLMGRILPYMLGTQGDFWIDDEDILIHVPADRVPVDREPAGRTPQEQRQSQYKVFQQHREARQAREDFESFRYRVSKDLEFIGSEQEGDQSPFYKENPDIWAVDQGIIHEKYLQQKHSEAERAALTSMLKQQLLRPQGAQEQQQQADPLVVNGSTPYFTTTVTTTHERQPEFFSQPGFKALTPQPDTTAQQQPNVKAARAPLREEQRRYRPRQQQAQQQSKGSISYIVHDQPPKPAASGTTAPKTDTHIPQETQPTHRASGFHQPAYPGSDLLMCEPKSQRKQQPQQQSKPANPHVVKDSCPKFAALEATEPKTNIRVPHETQPKAHAAGWHQPAYPGEDLLMCEPAAPRQRQNAFLAPQVAQQTTPQVAEQIAHIPNYAAFSPPPPVINPQPKAPAAPSQPAGPGTDTHGQQQQKAQPGNSRFAWRGPQKAQPGTSIFAWPPPPSHRLADAPSLFSSGAFGGNVPVNPYGPCPARPTAQQQAQRVHSQIVDSFRAPKPPSTTAKPTPPVPAKREEPEAQPTVSKPPPSHGPWAVWPPEEIGLLQYAMDRSVVKQLSDQEQQVRAQLQAVNDWGWLRRRVIDLGTARGLNPWEEPLPKTAEEATRRSRRLVDQLLDTPLAPHEQNLVADYSMGPGEYVSRSVARILAGPAAAKLPELTTPRSYVRAKIDSGDLSDPDFDHPLAPQWPWPDVFTLEDEGPTGRGDRTTPPPPPPPPARQLFENLGEYGVWGPKPGPSDDQKGQQHDLCDGLFTRRAEAQPSSSTTAGATPDTPSVTVPSTIKTDGVNMPEIVVGSRVAPNNSSEATDVPMKGVDDTHQPQNKDKGKEKEKETAATAPAEHSMPHGKPRRTGIKFSPSLEEFIEATLEGNHDYHQPEGKGKGKAKEKVVVVPAKRSMPPGMARRKVRQSMASNTPIIKAYDATMKRNHDSHQPGGKGKGKGEENSKEQNPPVLLEKRIGGHNYTFLRSPSAVTRMEDEQKQEAAVVGAASPSTNSSLPDLIEACDVVMEDSDGANQLDTKGKGKEKEQDLPELTDSATLRRCAGDLSGLTESEVEVLLCAKGYFQNLPAPSPAEAPRPKVSEELQGREPSTRHDLDKDYIASIRPLFYDFGRATTTGRASNKVAPPPPESPQEAEQSQFDFKDFFRPPSDADYLASATPTSEYDTTQRDSIFPPPPAEPPRPTSQDKKTSHRGVRGGRPRRSENEQQQQVKTTPQPTKPSNEEHNPPQDDNDYLDSITPSSSYDFGRAAPTSGNNNMNAAPSPAEEETQQQQRQDNALHPSDPSATPPSTVSWDDVMEMDFNAVFPSVADLRGLSSPDARSEDSWTDAVMEQDGESSGSSDDF